MKTYEFGNIEANAILIQMVDDHDLFSIENEVSEISARAGNGFRLLAIKVNDWNRDLSPWTSPAVFGNEAFGDGAAATLNEIMKFCENPDKTYYIGGYSLSGLFALWTACQTDVFSGVAAASPSVWFPGFVDYMGRNQIMCNRVYLSLGDREEKTKNPVMSEVGRCIRMVHEVLQEQGVRCVLEWNKGNHFKDADIRTAKAFSWVMGATSNEVHHS